MAHVSRQFGILIAMVLKLITHPLNLHINFMCVRIYLSVHTYTYYYILEEALGWTAHISELEIVCKLSSSCIHVREPIRIHI